MKLLVVVLMLAAAAAQAVPVQQDEPLRNLLIVDQLISIFETYFRGVIYGGDESLGLPPMDPFRVDDADIHIPFQLLNFDLKLNGANLTGMGGFRLDRADMSILSLILHYDIVIPHISVRAAGYDMNGLFVNLLPIYGKGEASYDLVNLRMVGQAQMGRSDDGRALIVKEIGDATFSLDAFVSRTTGHIGGGDIDKVFNAILSDLVSDYVSRFSRHISFRTTPIIRDVCNVMLERLDTWAILFPRG